MSVLMVNMRIELFGGLKLVQDERVVTRFRTQKTGGLLAYLACHFERAHPREELVDLFWPDSDLETGRMSLRTALSSLRRILEPPGVPEGAILLTDRYQVQLNGAAVTTDLGDFERAIKGAGRTEDDVEHEHLLTRAVALYSGPLLAGFYDNWAINERTRAEQLYLDALRRLTTLLEHAGDLGRAIECAHRIIAVDPLQEEAHAGLMRLYAAAGQPAAAKRQYREMTRLLREQLNVAPSQATRDLMERLSHAGAAPTAPMAVVRVALREEPTRERPAASAAPLPSPPRRPGLPMHLTRFFGRERETQQILETLQAGQTRLVTLTGPGGAGKTRLAVEIARRVTPLYPDGLWFVPLADLSDASLIAGAIRDAMGLERIPGTDPAEQVAGALASALAGRSGLLVLDNFEHLAEEGSALVWMLLERAPGLVCLVTSRRRLDIAGEREYPVPPLPVPDAPESPERLLGFPGVALFVDRAQSVVTDFQVTEGNAQAVSALCTRLEGIPLAIELAAGWAQTLTPAQMLSQLARRFDLLVSRRKDLSERHLSLRSAIDWSYRRLGPELQRFFASLAVFRGGWTLEAAQAVCEEPLAMDYLKQLREHSLIVSEQSGEAMRYRLLDTLREYALEQMSEAERRERSRAHARYCLSLAQQARKNWYGPEEADWFDRLEAEHDNLRAALAWAREEPDARDMGLELAALLRWFWYVRGHFGEGCRWLTAMLAMPRMQARTEARAEALYGAGELTNAQGDSRRAMDYYAESLEIWRELGQTRGMADTLCHMGLAVQDQGDHSKARPYFEQAAALYQELGDRGGRAHALKCLGENALRDDDLDRAEPLYEEALAIYRALNDPRGTSMMLGEIGQLAMLRRDHARARVVLEEHVALSHRLKDTSQTAHALWNLGNVCYERADYLGARAYYEEALALRRQLGGILRQVDVLAPLARAAWMAGDIASGRARFQEAIGLLREQEDNRRAGTSMEMLADVMLARPGDIPKRACGVARLLAAAEARRETVGALVHAVEQAAREPHIQALREAMGEADFAAARTEGASMSYTEALDCAASLLASPGR